MFHFFQLLTFIPYNNSHFLNIMKNIDMNTELASAFLHVERIPEYITPPTYDTMFFPCSLPKWSFFSINSVIVSRTRSAAHLDLLVNLSTRKQMKTYPTPYASPITT